MTKGPSHPDARHLRALVRHGPDALDDYLRAWRNAYLKRKAAAQLMIAWRLVTRLSAALRHVASPPRPSDRASSPSPYAKG